MSPPEEDLIREATALHQRIEVQVGDEEPWIWGRRSNGCVTVFCGPVVFQFNSSNEIRRAFADGHRIKSEQGRFIRLQRSSRGGGIHFDETTLDEQQQLTLLDGARQSLTKLAGALNSGAAVRGEGADIGELSAAAGRWLKECLAKPLVVADQPHAR